MANRQGHKEGDKDAERIDIDGVVDSYKHLGNFGSIAISRLFESSDKDGYSCLCPATFSNWYCP